MIKYFKEHRRSKVIFRTLEAIKEGGINNNSICDGMGIQRKHISRVKSYLEQLMLHNMISLDNGIYHLENYGKDFLNLN